MTAGTMRLEEAAAIMRASVRDKSYRLTGLGDEVDAYLRSKRRRLSESSFQVYEGTLDKLCRHFADKKIPDFEPPIGTELLEEFLDAFWGAGAPATYNKNLSILRECFKFWLIREKIHGDPTLPISPAKKRQVYRETFSSDDRSRLIASQDSRRDRIALRLLFDCGLRKGALQRVQFRHFDHQRRRLVVFTKGGKVREVPIPEPELWLDLERHILEIGAAGHHFLLCSRERKPIGVPADRPEKPMSHHAIEKWWYRCLVNAEIVSEGTTSGERMHKARHTFGQRILDKTGNLKAAQVALGHASIQTTADVYTDWDINQLTATLEDVLANSPSDDRKSPAND